MSERDAKRLLVGLLAVDLVLALMGLVHVAAGERIWTLHGLLFDMDEETTIPAWFSSMQFFSIGLVLLLLWHRGGAATPSGRFLLIFGAAFVFLSMDEAAMVHERVNGALANNASALPQLEDGHGIWMYLYAIAAILLLLLIWRDLLEVWRRFRPASLVVLVGMAIFVFGAVVLELLTYFGMRRDVTSWLFRAEVVLEELFELMGVSVMLYGTLLFALHKIRVDASASASGAGRAAGPVLDTVRQGGG